MIDLRQLKQNIREFQFTWKEISGSVGDMGLYIPLVTALVTLCSLDIVSTLFFSGIFNVITGIQFGIPMCVQPMKAIATVAIAEGLNSQQVLAAGIMTGLVVLLAGITNVVDLLVKYIPKVVVRGIQVALGIKLIIKALEMIYSQGVLVGVNSLSTGILCILLLIVLSRSRHIPAALIVFSLGALWLIGFHGDIFAKYQFSLYSPIPYWVSIDDLLKGGFVASLPQIPLTLLNSVVAVTALARDLFPTKIFSEKGLALSVGLMNIVGCLFGSIPMCHGAGGLAGQYKYGARSGFSMVFLGSIKIVLALFFGSILMKLFAAYPTSILGAMLLLVGVELVLLGKDVVEQKGRTLLCLTVLSILFFETAVGFMIGISFAYILQWLFPPKREQTGEEQ